VSTCQARATNYVFCSVACWDTHLPIERHKQNAGALERKAPSNPEPNKIIPTKTQSKAPTLDNEILVVASKVRAYISEKSGMNTSASTYEALSEKIRIICDKAMDEARAQGRKTVLDRDVL
jgi:histone H3/H4